MKNRPWSVAHTRILDIGKSPSPRPGNRLIKILHFASKDDRGAKNIKEAMYVYLLLLAEQLVNRFEQRYNFLENTIYSLVFNRYL